MSTCLKADTDWQTMQNVRIQMSKIMTNETKPPKDTHEFIPMTTSCWRANGK